MLEYKNPLKGGEFVEVDIFIIGIRKSRKYYRNVIKRNAQLCKLRVIVLFNPRFGTELEDIIRTKRFRSALYNLPFLFGLR